MEPRGPQEGSKLAENEANGATPRTQHTTLAMLRPSAPFIFPPKGPGPGPRRPRPRPGRLKIGGN
eukprot:6986209-Karenia_brevis.AAC.1